MNMNPFYRRFNQITFAVILGILTISCSGEEEIAKPDLLITAVTVSEGDSGESLADIVITASIAAQEDIILSYYTEDNSAKSGTDFTGVVEGSALIPVGSKETTIQISIITDNIMEFKENFKVNFSDPENAVLDNNFTFITILDDDEPAVSEHAADGFISPETYPSMKLAWSDEFEGPDINTNDWTFEIGDGCPDVCGWGNQELEWYTNSEENAKIVDGKLVITAKTGDPAHPYTSARMITKDKQEFKYGRIDIRAKLPKGQGIWPAIWMLGTNIGEVGWPACGEIDIMELVGHEPDKSHGTVHYDANGSTFIGNFHTLSDGAIYQDEFHIFTIFWEENSIKWYIDYHKFYEINQASIGNTYPFNDSFFFILNVAVGGLWPGDPDETTVFPQEMVLDYIRVFQPE